MYFFSFSEKKMGLTNQIFALSNGINNAIKNNYKVVVIDRFLTDYNEDNYINISNVLDIDQMNIYFRQKYDLILVDRYNFNFELLNVNYGVESNYLDITQNIKKYFYNNGKLFIKKDTNLNNIQGDPCYGIVKHILLKYSINNHIVIDKYMENLERHIDYTNDNYIRCSMGWPSKTYDTFLDILLHIKYNKIFLDISSKQLSMINLTNKVNLIHLRIEDDAIDHRSRMNKMNREDFKIKLENKYIYLIQQYIDKKDITILLSSSFDNNVINFLNDNKYNYFKSTKNFKYRELNAIIDLIISRQCNNIFIGNFNLNGNNGSSFSYYIYKNLTSKNIIYKYIDLDHL